MSDSPKPKHPARDEVLTALRSNLSTDHGQEVANAAAYGLLSANPVLVEVAAERAYQDGRWGGRDHDDEHNHNDWIAFVEQRLGALCGEPSDRHFLLEIAALAIAAVEWTDRRDKSAADALAQRLLNMVNDDNDLFHAAMKANPLLRSRLHMETQPPFPPLSVAMPITSNIVVPDGQRQTILPTSQMLKVMHLRQLGTTTVCGLDTTGLNWSNQPFTVNCQACLRAVPLPYVHLGIAKGGMPKTLCGLPTHDPPIPTVHHNDQLIGIHLSGLTLPEHPRCLRCLDKLEQMGGVL